MNFLQWLWAFAILAGYTDATEDALWVANDEDEDGQDKPFIFFATTRPVDDESHILLLASYGWAKLIPKNPGEWHGSVFRHPGW